MKARRQNDCRKHSAKQVQASMDRTPLGLLAASRVMGRYRRLCGMRQVVTTHSVRLYRLYSIPPANISWGNNPTLVNPITKLHKHDLPRQEGTVLKLTLSHTPLNKLVNMGGGVASGPMSPQRFHLKGLSIHTSKLPNNDYQNSWFKAPRFLNAHAYTQTEHSFFACPTFIYTLFH